MLGRLEGMGGQGRPRASRLEHTAGRMSSAFFESIYRCEHTIERLPNLWWCCSRDLRVRVTREEGATSPSSGSSGLWIASVELWVFMNGDRDR